MVPPDSTGARGAALISSSSRSASSRRPSTIAAAASTARSWMRVVVRPRARRGPGGRRRRAARLGRGGRAGRRGRPAGCCCRARLQTAVVGPPQLERPLARRPRHPRGRRRSPGGGSHHCRASIAVCRSGSMAQSHQRGRRTPMVARSMTASTAEAAPGAGSRRPRTVGRRAGPGARAGCTDLGDGGVHHDHAGAAAGGVDEVRRRLPARAGRSSTAPSTAMITRVLAADRPAAAEGGEQAPRRSPGPARPSASRSTSARLFSSTAQRAHHGDLVAGRRAPSSVPAAQVRAQRAQRGAARRRSSPRDELHPAELADRLEHPVAQPELGVLAHGEQGLADQRLDRRRARRGRARRSAPSRENPSWKTDEPAQRAPLGARRAGSRTSR